MVNRIKCQLWAANTGLQHERGGEGGSLYHKVHKLSLGLVRGDKVLEAALDSRNSRYGARCSLEALDSGDVVFLLTAVKTAPGS